MNDKRQGAVALKLFIEKSIELEPSLKEKRYREWPFDFELQKGAWLRTLALSCTATKKTRSSLNGIRSQILCLRRPPRMNQ